MLRELHITNLAVIEDATLDLAPGLNCFTGQTGAGKSLMLGAFGLLLGLKSANAADLLRPGADEARVSGIFEIRDPDVAQQIADVIDQPLEPGEELLLTRKIFASGRSSASVNGQPATAAMIRNVGELLVDIHGQHDHQSLLKPANQLLILDTFGRCLDDRRTFNQQRAQLRDLIDRRDTLAQSATLRRQQLELYEFQAEEIDALDPVEGEYEELRARHDLLSNLQRVQADAAQVVDALHEADGSIIDRLQAVVAVLRDIAELDESIEDTVEQVRSAALSLQDSAFDLTRYRDRLDLDPAELDEVEQRLNALNRLLSKYGDARVNAENPLAQLLAYREQIQAEIERLRHENVDLDNIDQQIDHRRGELETLGSKLTAARKKAATRLRPLVESQLNDLGMADAELHVEFSEHDDTQGQGGEADDEHDAHESRNAHETPDPLPRLPHVEFMIRTNPGQPARPLRRIASGGEMSRIMLALKSVFAQSDRISVLVFDEIDANIGGRLGTVIGTKLRKIANAKPAETVSDTVSPTSPDRKGGVSPRNHKGSKKKHTGPLPDTNPPSAEQTGSHQVLCITHLPQIAAFADRHLRIAKTVTGRGQSRVTTTTVAVLEGDSRVEELAEMLAGKQATTTTRKQVEEMLAAANP